MQHRGGPHPGAEIGGTGRQVTMLVIKGIINILLQLGIDLVDHVESGLEVQAGLDRLHAKVVLLIDHDAKRLFTVHHHRTAVALGCLLPADEMTLHKHLLADCGQVT